MKEKFDQNEKLSKLKEFLHFSCTSEDINNLSYALMIHNSLKDVILPTLRSLNERLELLS